MERTLLAGILAAALAGPAAAEGMHHSANRHDGGHGMHGTGGEHAAHARMLTQSGYQRSEHRYPVPGISLTDRRGERVALSDYLADDRPVMLNFIYSTCTTICPVMSATFAEVRRELGTDAGSLRLVSITIDPEHDTAVRLSRYADTFDAGSRWRFLTGSHDDIITAQKAFDIYRGSKTNHIPVTFMRTASDRPWVRIEGLATAGELAAEYRALAKR